MAGDCATTRALATSTFTTGNGELCGATHVSAYTVTDVPASPGADEVVYSSVLTTEGSRDGTLAKGRSTWFHTLERGGGTWRLAGGGSGP